MWERRISMFPILDTSLCAVPTLFFTHFTYSLWCHIINEQMKIFWIFVLNAWYSRTTDTQWQHKSKISENLGRCGRQNMLPPYLKIWDWDWVFGRAVKTISSLGVRSPCLGMYHKVVSSTLLFNFWAILVLLTKTHY